MLNIIQLEECTIIRFVRAHWASPKNNLLKLGVAGHHGNPAYESMVHMFAHNQLD